MVLIGRRGVAQRSVGGIRSGTVDPHRGYSEQFPADADDRWQSGERGFPPSEWDRRDEPRRSEPGYGDSEEYRVPGQRAAAAPRGRRSGEPLPPPIEEGPPRHEPPPGREMPTEDGRHLTEPLDRSALRRGAGGAASGGAGPSGTVSGGAVSGGRGRGGTAGRGVYRSRKPALATLVIVVGAAFELLALQMVATGMTKQLAGTTTVGMLLSMGLPLVGVGLYALFTGAASVSFGAQASQAWLRSPLACLPVGLVLLLAAAIAL